jgi:DNA-binding beta-propeller fold protein YncE
MSGASTTVGLACWPLQIRRYLSAVQLCPGWSAIAITPDGKTAYVANAVSGTVTSA